MNAWLLGMWPLDKSALGRRDGMVSWTPAACGAFKEPFIQSHVKQDTGYTAENLFHMLHLGSHAHWEWWWINLSLSLAREKNLLNIFPTNRCASIFSCRDWEIALLSWLYFHHLTISIWKAFPSRDKTWRTGRAKNHNKRANPCNPY